jgi:hypothetical protein
MLSRENLATSKAHGKAARTAGERWSSGPKIISSLNSWAGRRLVISPFAIIPSIPAALSQSAWFYETRETFPTGGTRPPPVARDLRLSEAAGISARFPWLLPAAAIERDGKLIRLVDGGYFDNSGIETALNVIEVLTGLRQIHLDHPAEGDGRFDYFDFDIHLITISGSGVDSPDTLQGLSDVLAPIQALFSARNAEGSLAYVRGQTALRSSRDDTHPAATLDEQDMPLALGFQMSGNSIGLIAAEVGEASQCGRFLAPFVQEAARITPDPQWIMEYVRENSYTSCLMKYLLSGENMPTGNAYPEEPQSSPPHWSSILFGRKDGLRANLPVNILAPLARPAALGRRQLPASRVHRLKSEYREPLHLRA